MSQPTGPRVFNSYSHDSPEHRERVLKFANRLRKDGVDAWIDQFDMHHAYPWRTWMRREIEKARKVLMVFTPAYKRRFERNEEFGRGNGATFEGIVIGQSIYDGGGKNGKFRAVLFEGCDGDGVPYSEACISIDIKAYTHYRPETPLGYEELVRWIYDQPVAVPDEIGTPPAFLTQPAKPVATPSDQPQISASEIASLPGLYHSRQSVFREECKTIPVFGRLRPDIPMDQSFINLTLDARFREQEQEMQVPHFLDHEDADRRGDPDQQGHKERRWESANLPIGAKTLWQTYSKGLIIGLPGAGKTTILRHFAHLAFSADPESLVLFLPCRSLKPHHVGLGDGRPAGNRDLPTIFRQLSAAFLYPETDALDATHAGHADVRQLAVCLEVAWRNGRAIILIDALDETPDPRVKQAVIDSAAALLSAIPIHRIAAEDDEPPTQPTVAASNRVFLTARMISSGCRRCISRCLRGHHSIRSRCVTLPGTYSGRTVTRFADSMTESGVSRSCRRWVARR